VTERQRTGRSYDAVADDYAGSLGDELRHKPFDRALLDTVVENAAGGIVADLGSGPGHVAGHLRQKGARVVALDLSPEMCRHAHALGLPSAAGDLTRLPIGDATVAGVVCFYAVIHLDVAGRATAYAELARVLRPGGTALIAFHTRDSDTPEGCERRMDSMWDHEVDLTFRFLSPDEETSLLTEAGLRLAARLDRPPRAGAEHASDRCYLVVER
jgi:SAM-dependent methyltransferase